MSTSKSINRMRPHCGRDMEREPRPYPVFKAGVKSPRRRELHVEKGERESS